MEGKSLTVKNACKMGNAKFQEIVSSHESGSLFAETVEACERLRGMKQSRERPKSLPMPNVLSSSSAVRPLVRPWR